MAKKISGIVKKMLFGFEHDDVPSAKDLAPKEPGIPKLGQSHESGFSSEKVEKTVKDFNLFGIFGEKKESEPEEKKEHKMHAPSHAKTPPHSATMHPKAKNVPAKKPEKKKKGQKAGKQSKPGQKSFAKHSGAKKPKTKTLKGKTFPSHEQMHKKIKKLKEKVSSLAKKHNVSKEEIDEAHEKISTHDTIREKGSLPTLKEIEEKLQDTKTAESLGGKKDEILGMIEEIKKHRIVTDFDRVYSTVQESQRIQVNRISAQLGIPKKRVEDCAQILESDRLIEMEYPAFGDPFLVLPGYKEKLQKEKEKKKKAKGGKKNV